MHYDSRRVVQTLGEVLDCLDVHWGALTDDDRDRIMKARLDLAEQTESLNSFTRNIKIVNFLQFLETIPSVLANCGAVLQAGKTDQVFRSSGTVTDTAAMTVAERLRQPPVAQAFSAAAIPKGLTGAAPISVDYFTRVDFPGNVKLHEEKPLIVRLVLNRPEESQLESTLSIEFADTKQPEIVDVMVTATGFSEHTGCWHRSITVFSDQDSQPAIFLLKAEDLGAQRITVDFYHQGRNVGSGAFGAQISNYAGGAFGLTPLTDFVGMEKISATPPQPPDVELRVIKGQNDNTLTFTLHSHRADVGYFWRSMGAVTLTADNPRHFLESDYYRLSELAAKGATTEAETKTITAELEAIGQKLWESVLSDEMRREYWRLKTLRETGKINSLMITTDEPWIPWELIRPYAMNTDTFEEQTDGFWAQKWQLTRWLAGRGPIDGLKISEARLVAPELNLPFVQREKSYFEELGRDNIQVATPIGTKDDLLEATDNGSIQLFHFSTHGLFRPDRPDESPIMMMNNKELWPQDLLSRSRNLRINRPIVFLNACHTAQIAQSLSGLGGWAATLVGTKIGVGAFVGSLWEVNDELASHFAEQFYRNLRRDMTLGAAFHAARMFIRDKNPANSTWLAYTLYGDPNIRVTWVAANE